MVKQDETETNGQAINIRIPLDLYTKYRAASKKSGIHMITLFTAALNFYPLDKFIKNVEEAKKL
jgi:hypothetical protein